MNQYFTGMNLMNNQTIDYPLEILMSTILVAYLGNKCRKNDQLMQKSDYKLEFS